MKIENFYHDKSVFILFQKNNSFFKKKQTNDSYLLNFFKNLLSNKNFKLIREKKKIPIIWNKEKNQKIYVSISHKEDFFLIAFSAYYQLGLDLEIFQKKSVTDFSSFLSLSKRFFPHQEYRKVKENQNPQVIFLKLWTKKEALYKLMQKMTQQELSGNFLTFLKTRLSLLRKKFKTQKITLPPHHAKNHRFIAYLAVERKMLPFQKIKIKYL